MKGWMIAVGVLGLASIAPIWRGAGHSRHDGVSFWHMLSDSTRSEYYPFGCPHLPYDEAVRQARLAYQQYIWELEYGNVVVAEPG